MLRAQKYVNIYTEANPNPNSLKFAANFMLVPDGTDFDFANVEAAAASPLAQAIFELGNIERVFLMSNFVTVTKTADVEWVEITPIIKKTVKEYLESDRPVLTQKTMDDYESATQQPDTELVKKIKGLLDEYVRPAVESDGGAISFHSYNEGVVKVQLRGSCSGCPSSTLTLKAGIENLLKRMLPNDITEVVAEGV
ncbi:Fe-S cluster biogenesis protein NfuA, 4Fe-4S-binding domain [Flexibacter flexilis DSM 6793]|uniref:Fe-S cluster biogenesis protein NfuA, 4Fe-4S-binding domain n=1 Tax=Flexibacter flexilis DSM 6793 TaxID=927664 RepID=A0A1I1MWW6_9BACT|nr:NifU family protein [Flexibacter flexilis]SFC89402.1 Fe-S cluster biogenesis protein NfuA, 4Fe-4S-binding domain [Flexibacter flexilis DSM 6793]